MKAVSLLIFLLLLILPGCWLIWPDDYDSFEFDTIITDYPANLHGINSGWDDYNSDLPFGYQPEVIYFSSNSPSSGKNFDLVYKTIEITYHPDDRNIINVSYPENYIIDSDIMSKLLIINTEYNEFGPLEFINTYGTYTFFANDEGGDLNIKFIYSSQGKQYGPLKAAALNSQSDDAYPTLNSSATRIYFCSNRESNQFDIYYAEIPSSVTLQDYLINKGAVTIFKEPVLSGTGNDKCPFINRNLLVFTSDREGGYGGFDLYYSTYLDGKWSTPVNFGNKINTEYDEYRPVTIATYITKDDLMIFSSDRPGGKGGFDLYCVNIGDKIENPSYFQK